MNQKSLFDDLPHSFSAKGPVTCLGQTFENDEIRRAHFTEELRKKIQDPGFRAIEGFPIGEDEDILALSDPPYYTACPNPWLNDFIKQWEEEKRTPDGDKPYHRDPFAADVSEGKNDAIYCAHSYHTKVPHKAVMRYILHFTEPGDIVFDGFCGTGMTGVAAQMCGDKATIESLGITKDSPEQKYKVEKDGTIFERQINEKGKMEWVAFSKLGARKSILNDLSTAATFIAYNYNSPITPYAFNKASSSILEEVEKECGWMYKTLHTDGSVCDIDYVVWSEVFICPNCTAEIIFSEIALDAETNQIKKDLICASCNTILKKNDLELVYESTWDDYIAKPHRTPKRSPFIIVYKKGKNKFRKKPDSYDIEILNRISKSETPTFPLREVPDMQMMRVGRMKPSNITHLHHFFLKRPLLTLACLWGKAINQEDASLRFKMMYFVEQSVWGLSILARYTPTHFSQVNQYLSGVFYMASHIVDVSPNYILGGKQKRLTKVFEKLSTSPNNTVVSTQDTANISIPEGSVDYIFIDPPFGENIYYSDLNFLIESLYNVKTNSTNEAIIDKVKGKEFIDYQRLMTGCFKKAYIALKAGGWLTVEFSNSSAGIWNLIQNSLGEAGFVISNVSALDKKQRSFQSVVSPTAVKQDLVISAYKPNGGFENRFLKEAQTEEGVWDFVRTHLKYLSVVKKQGRDIVIVPERDPRILFDQMVAYFVRKGYQVPLSSQEFQIGLSQRFSERDGMIFLPEQVVEYDRKKMIGGGGPVQQSLFVSDEASAIQWLRQVLKNKPQSTQDVRTSFMKEIGGWKKTEKPLELSTLLKQNFFCYDGKEKVPEQIHAYLSSNWREMRNLTKDDPALIAKAKDCWYVPDPTKAGDLEKIRERDLLKEFESYKAVKKFKRTDRFRLEAVRAGFKTSWQARDYNTIVSIAEKIPNNILEEDPKLLMWYDQAVTRMGIE